MIIPPCKNILDYIRLHVRVCIIDLELFSTTSVLCVCNYVRAGMYVSDTECQGQFLSSTKKPLMFLHLCAYL